MEMIVQDRSIKLECENYGILGEWSVIKQTVLIKEKQNKCTISYKEYSNNINHIEKKPTLLAKEEISRKVVNDLFVDLFKIDFNKLTKEINTGCDGFIYKLCFSSGFNSTQFIRWCSSDQDFNSLCERILKLGEEIGKRGTPREGWRKTIDEVYKSMEKNI